MKQIPKNPSETSFEIAGSVEHELLARGFAAPSVKFLAQIIEPHIAKIDRKTERLHNAFAGLMQLAMILGADAESLRTMAERAEDKPDGWPNKRVDTND